MRRIALPLMMIFLAGCGGASTQPSSGPAPHPEASAPSVDTTLATLAAHKPLPEFPLGVPTFIDPQFDAAGVILDPEHGDIENPTLIARYALRLYTQFLAAPSRSDYIYAALTQTDWLVAHLDCKGGVGVWHYSFASDFGAEPGWASAFGNAHGIVALLTFAGFASDPEDYVKAARCALHAFGVDVSAGGLATTVGDGLWFEEYATAERSGVLNGHLFALAGLNWTCHEAGWQEACDLFQNGVSALENRLPQYDAGFYSMYSLEPGNYASPLYNALQANALEWLDSIVPAPILSKYANLFTDYEAGGFDVTTSSCTDSAHCTDALADGLPWYGYWSAYRFPVTLDIDLGQTQTVRALSLFFVGTAAAPFEVAPVDDDGTVGTYRQPQPVTSAEHTTSDQVTTAAEYTVNLTAQRIRLQFAVPMASGVIALREIDVLH